MSRTFFLISQNYLSSQVVKEIWQNKMHSVYKKLEKKKRYFDKVLQNKLFHKLAIPLSFLAFRYVCALFCEIANQSLYTSHNVANFVHLWFWEKLDEKLAISSSLTFCENTDRLARTARLEKWLGSRFTKCHLYTSRFSCLANIFSRSRQFDDKCIPGYRVAQGRAEWARLRVAFVLYKA